MHMYMYVNNARGRATKIPSLRQFYMFTYMYLDSNIVFKSLKFKVGVLLWGNFSIGLRVVSCHVVREDTRTAKVTLFSRNLKV